MARYDRSKLRPVEEVYAGHRTIQQDSLEERLLRKCGKTPEERANNLAGDPHATVGSQARHTLGPEKALDLARSIGAAELMGQLRRMEEADRVLQLAWEAGVFAECMLVKKSAFLQRDRVVLDEDELELSEKSLKEAALELLAEQYGDLHVKVQPLQRWMDPTKMKKCPVRTLGGPERKAVR